MAPSDPVFPNAPMIERLREREQHYDVGVPAIVTRPAHRMVDPVLRDRLDRIAENHPFPDGQP